MSEATTNISVTPDVGVTIALSHDAKTRLRAMTGPTAPFREMMDAFRFAVSLGLAICKDRPPVLSNQESETLYNMGSFDPNRWFQEAFTLIAPNAVNEERLVRLVRAYGEYGISLMSQAFEVADGELSIADLIDELRQGAFNPPDKEGDH